MDNRVECGDCLEIMESIPDGSIDTILTDPPYLTTDLFFDKEGFCKDLVLQSFKRILKSDGYFISFGSIELLGYFSSVFPVRWTGVWLKPNGTMRTASAKKPMSRSELYAVFAHPNHSIKNLVFNRIKTYGHSPYRTIQRKSQYKRDGRDSLSRSNTSAWTEDGYVIENTDGSRWQTDVIEAPSKQYMKYAERTDHPTQKPVKLLSTLIRMLTNENDLILDPFAGSGSLGVACMQTNRRFFLIEKNQKFFDILSHRLNQPSQLNLIV